MCENSKMQKECETANTAELDIVKQTNQKITPATGVLSDEVLQEMFFQYLALMPSIDDLLDL